MKLIELDELDAIDILEADFSLGKQSIYPSMFHGRWFQRESFDPPTRMASRDGVFSSLGFTFSRCAIDVSAPVQQLVDEGHDALLIVSDLMLWGGEPHRVAEVFRLKKLDPTFLLQNDKKIKPVISNIQDYMAIAKASEANLEVQRLMKQIAPE